MEKSSNREGNIENNLNFQNNLKYHNYENSSKYDPENLTEDFVNESFNRNDPNFNAVTVRINNDYYTNNKINFDIVKANNSQNNNKNSIFDNMNKIPDGNIDIHDNGDSILKSSCNIKEEIKTIEEHFIGTNRDFKPILYDEDLNNIIEIERNIKLKNSNNYQNKEKENIQNSEKNYNNGYKEPNNIINIKLEEPKELDNQSFDDNIVFKKTNRDKLEYLQPEQIKEENDEKYNNFNKENYLIKNDKHFDDNVVTNYRNEKFANTDEIMIVSFIEEKMKTDHKGIFYGKKKIYLFVNKKSGSREGIEILHISEKHHKNFEVNSTDLNLFNELYENIFVVKITNNIINKNNQSEDMYIFVVDLIENQSRIIGIEMLRQDNIYGNFNNSNLNK